jgi:Amt family ammonium transporter
VAAVNCPPKLAIDGKLGLIEGNWHPVMNQAMAVALTWALAALGSWIILLIVDATVGLRVSDEEEYDGLDLTQHGESGYNLEEVMSSGAHEERA